MYNHEGDWVYADAQEMQRVFAERLPEIRDGMEKAQAAAAAQAAAQAAAAKALAATRPWPAAAAAAERTSWFPQPLTRPSFCCTPLSL